MIKQSRINSDDAVWVYNYFAYYDCLLDKKTIPIFSLAIVTTQYNPYYPTLVNDFPYYTGRSFIDKIYKIP